MTAKDYKEFINKRILPYDHFLDKKSSANEKFSKRIELVKDENFLPNYLLENKEKYKTWFE